MVGDDEVTDLPDLLGFRFVAEGLRVENFRDAFLEEDRVAAFAGAAGETRALQHEAEIIECEVRIGTTFEDFGDGLFNSAHVCGGVVGPGRVVTPFEKGVSS